MEWWGKERSQLLYLMLKSPAITRMLLIFIPVSLRWVQIDINQEVNGTCYDLKLELRLYLGKGWERVKGNE